MVGKGKGFTPGRKDAIKGKWNYIIIGLVGDEV